VSGHEDVQGPEEPTIETTVREAEPLTGVAEPVVIDLRAGVDTVAVYEAEAARRAAAT
jgi:hypothetical protein